MLSDALKGLFSWLSTNGQQDYPTTDQFGRPVPSVLGPTGGREIPDFPPTITMKSLPAPTIFVNFIEFILVSKNNRLQ